jgi:hypothetical protein
MGKKLKGKKPTNHIQKAHIPKKMWNSKTLKIQFKKKLIHNFKNSKVFCHI